MNWIDSGQLSARGARSTRRMLIGGEWGASNSGASIAVIDPASEQHIADLAAGTRSDVDNAVQAARRAFEAGWARTSGGLRARLLWRLAELIEANADEIATIETIDNGKPLAVARAVDIGGAVERLRYSAGWATRINGETMSPIHAPDSHAYTLREPCGVVGIIVPWNFPFSMAVSKIGDAIAAGCTVVLKPAEDTSLSTLRLGELIIEAGFPAGVVNIVTGYGPEAGQAIVDHPGVDKISFTGSTKVGKSLMASAAGSLKRLTLELGGKSPAIVFDDADFAVAVQSVFRNITFNSGQVCAAGSRVYAHRAIYDRLVEAVSARAKALRVGPGLSPGTEMGPLVSQRQLDRVSGYIEDAKERGAEIVAGGSRLGGVGFFIEPTIVTGIEPDMPMWREEIFGPVLGIVPFHDEDLDGLAALANDTDYGLTAYVYTRDISKAHRMARLIKAGVIRVNGGAMDMTVPFGGFKQSGVGRENGCEGVLSFTEIKSVVVAL